jgi:UDP-N-acetylmuramoyl-tripeptide--D-alanyl-D-alanine ligase
MIEFLYEKFLESSGVSTDTRNISEGNIFFALKGPNFNANEFATNALESGASYVVIDQEQYKKDDRFIVVEDSLKALQSLANHHRKQFKIPIIGITGSNGKTTSKELINEVLKKKYKTLATTGNLNNHIGVPITLLNITKSIEIAIVEMGANKVGDIQELVEIAEPTHGLITNIGKAHIEGFGSFEGVIRGKSELYNWLIQSDGVVFINSNNEILRNMGKRFKNPLYYPNEGDFYHCKFIDADPNVKIEAENGEILKANIIGKYNFENIAAALCIGKFFQVSDKDANEAVKNYTPNNQRSQVMHKGSNTIILDCYNANPTSMKAAIDNIKSMDVNRKAVVLGDMYELGDEAESEHKKIGEIVATCDITTKIFVGKLMHNAKLMNPDAIYFENKQELMNHLEHFPFEETMILIKGSRGMGLETILEKL